MANKWKQDEDELIEKYVNTVPLTTIVARLNELNKDRGITRTRVSIQARLNKMGYSTSATENNMSCRTWSRKLGVNIHEICKWVKTDELVFREDHLSMNISRQAMIGFARKHPYYFKKIKKDILLYYFGGELADLIFNDKRDCPSVRVKAKKIKRLDTGKIYQSIAAAAIYLKMDRNTVRKIANRNGWLQFV
jgi:hypothetical protein